MPLLDESTARLPAGIEHVSSACRNPALITLALVLGPPFAASGVPAGSGGAPAWRGGW